MFFEEKDFWGIISGLPQRFCVSKRFVGIIYGAPKKRQSIFLGEIISGLPQRFCVSKRFVGKGGTSAPNVVFAVRQTPEKSAL